MQREADQTRAFRLARWVLVAVGVIFVVNGIVVTALHAAHVIPAGYYWQGPVFLLLGSIGGIASAVGLRQQRLWPVALAAVAYVPWTVLGLIGDSARGLWPLVGGEALGLAATFWAVFVRGRVRPPNNQMQRTRRG